MTRNEFLDHLIAKVHDIPALPATVVRVMQLIEDPLCSAAELARIIDMDPAMAAKILRLANSAFYGFRQKIGTTAQAVTLLGFATLKNALLSAAVFDLFQLSISTGFDMGGLWQHSIATATAAKLTAKRVRYPHAEKAYTAGLLHDVGKIIIARYLPTSLATVVRAVNDEQLAMYDAEQRILGLPHPGFGAWVLARWDMPAPLIEAVEFHHHPTKAPHSFDLAGIVYIANILTHRAGIGCGGDSLIREMDPLVPQYYGLNAAALQELEDELTFKRFEIEAFASLAACG